MIFLKLMPLALCEMWIMLWDIMKVLKLTQVLNPEKHSSVSL